MREFLGRHKILLGIELLGIFICLIFCFKPEKLIFSVDADTITAKMDADGYNDHYQSDKFVLSPGVYRLQIRGGDHEGIWYPKVSAEESTFQALRCNGATVFAHQREMDIEVYVADQVDTAFVSCDYIGETGQFIEEISLYHTGVGWRLLAFGLLLAAAGINLLIWLREVLHKRQIKKDQEMVIWVLGLCVLLAYLPYITDYFSLGADMGVHLLRIEGLKETLLHGQQFPVRVQEYWLYGHGYAVSSFYGDLFMLFPAILRIIGFNLMDAYKMFVLAVLAGTAGIAYYSFYRCTGNRYAALLGSVLYQLAPYHIHNFYKRNAVGEYLGMMFLPLVVCGIYQIYTGDREEPGYVRAKIPLIVGMSGILQSHILTCEMTVVALILMAVVLWRKTLQKAVLSELLKAALCCLLVNAWFWVPLLKMLSVDSYVLGEIVSRDIQYAGTELAGILQIYPYVGGPSTGMYNCAPIQAGAAFWIVLLCYLVLRLWRRLRSGEKRGGNLYDRVVGCGVVLSLISLFLSTRYFPWDWMAEIPGVGMLATAIQFPTRLLALTTLFFAFTSSFFVLWLWEEKKVWTVQSGNVVTAGCILAVAVAALWSALFHINDISYNMGPTRLYTAENMGNESVMNGEWLLAGMDPQEMGYHDPVADEGLFWRDYAKEGLKVQIYIENPTEEELYVELPLTGYRGYGLEADTGMTQPYIMQGRGNHGDLRIAVPSGYAGNVKVSYKGFAIFRVAEGISLLSVLTGMGMGIGRRHTRKRRNAEQEAAHE